MASLQMKGTQKEVGEAIQLFYSLRSKGVCSFKHFEEKRTYNSEYSELSIASIQIKEKMNKYEEEDSFVNQMLISVYND